jgi:hypothetical protein
MELMLYGVVKFIAYSLWGYLGFRLHQKETTYLGKSIGFGAARWVLGLALGILVFFLVGSIDQGQVLSHYLAIYSPVRVFEWTFMAVLFFPTWQEKWKSPRVYYWIVGGILLSFVTDLTSPQMLDGGRFCVGRCLC